jgi:hypothetical protein
MVIVALLPKAARPLVQPEMPHGHSVEPAAPRLAAAERQAGVTPRRAVLALAV